MTRSVTKKVVVRLVEEAESSSRCCLRLLTGLPYLVRARARARKALAREGAGRLTATIHACGVEGDVPNEPCLAPAHLPSLNFVQCAPFPE